MLSDADQRAMDCCALRFDGYLYEEGRGRTGLLADLTDRFVQSLEPSPDPQENLAAFFALQRHLGKWGGEQLPESSRVRVAFRSLFLVVYGSEVPEDLQIEEFQSEWRREHEDGADAVAARVRADLASSRSAGSDTVEPSD